MKTGTAESATQNMAGKNTKHDKNRGVQSLRFRSKVNASQPKSHIQMSQKPVEFQKTPSLKVSFQKIPLNNLKPLICFGSKNDLPQ